MHTAQQLAAEIALAESTAHVAGVPISGVGTTRPGQNRSQKLQLGKADHLHRTTVTPQKIEKKQKQCMESLILLKRISLNVLRLASLAHLLVRVHRIHVATNSVGCDGVGWTVDPEKPFTGWRTSSQTYTKYLVGMVGYGMNLIRDAAAMYETLRSSHDHYKECCSHGNNFSDEI